ncbi:hypothetical protein KIS4809_2979 [Bacillus sp. ZZV12-4809]|nr:hypothetical protein KIS4809_2979 [Bacillus sp. ZZV12-4809]
MLFGLSFKVALKNEFLRMGKSGTLNWNLVCWLVRPNAVSF